MLASLTGDSFIFRMRERRRCPEYESIPGRFTVECGLPRNKRVYIELLVKEKNINIDWFCWLEHRSVPHERRGGAAAGVGGSGATLAQLRGLSTTRSRSRTNAPKRDTSRSDSRTLESRFINAVRHHLSNSSGHTRAKIPAPRANVALRNIHPVSKVPLQNPDNNLMTIQLLHQVIQRRNWDVRRITMRPVLCKCFAVM